MAGETALEVIVRARTELSTAVDWLHIARRSLTEAGATIPAGRVGLIADQVAGERTALERMLP